jgi:hypothetical protein
MNKIVCSLAFALATLTSANLAYAGDDCYFDYMYDYDTYDYVYPH